MFKIFKRSNIVKGPRNEDLPLTHEGLPDSYRPNGLCPRCGKQSSFEKIGELPVTFTGGTVYMPDGKKYRSFSDKVTCLLCRHCNQGVVVIEEEWIDNQPSRLGCKRSGNISFRGISWWPLPQSNLSKDIPDEIKEIFSEAITTFYARAPRATAVMLRRTIEAITVYFGENEGTLAQRLLALSDKNILQPSLAEWVKEVRLIGNQGAHYDPANAVTMEDVQQLMNFVEELMKYLFILPAELSRRRNQQK